MSTVGRGLHVVFLAMLVDISIQARCSLFLGVQGRLGEIKGTEGLNN